MRIKKFKARNMVEALRKVKDELGEEAVILDSGKVAENGVEYYEVVAAVEEMNPEFVPLEVSPAPQVLPQDTSSPMDELKKELLEIKRDLKALVHYNLMGKHLLLLKEGVPEELVLELERSGLTLKDFILQALRKKGATPLSKTQVFIGEAGSGKTTSLFKIAFWYRVKKNYKVAILNADNYKIGGKEQAQKLSQLLEIPFYQTDWEDLGRHYPYLSENFDLLLIDTPSLSKRFSLYELTEIYRLYPFLRFNWVVRSTENARLLLDLWQEIKELPIDNLILTFLDKIKKGVQLFWLLSPETPLPGFGSMGERIPEDIEKLEEQTLLRLLLKDIEKLENP